MEKTVEKLDGPLVQIWKHITSIDLVAVFDVCMILLIAYVVNLLIKRFISRLIRKQVEVLKGDPTHFVFLKNTVSFFVYTVAIFAILGALGVKDLGTKLFASAGLVSAAVVFASQNTVSSLMSGIMILMFKPFKIGDTIELSNAQVGVVESITLRHTIVRDFQNQRIIIPNNSISDSTITNNTFGDSRVCKYIEVGIGYASDLDLAKNALQELVESHPDVLDVRTNDEKAQGLPKVRVRVVDLGDHAVKLRAYAWVPDSATGYVVKYDVFEQVKHLYDKIGVEIPHPYVNVLTPRDKNNI